MTLFVVPENPGTAITITGEETRRPPASIAETVAVIGTHDWGPARTPTLVSTFAEFEAVFGNTDSDLRDAVLGAFAGPGLDRFAGAGAVIVYRAGLASGGGALAASTVQLDNTSATGAITLTARHPGTRGDRLSVVVEDDPAAPSTRDRLRILLDGVTVERFAYPSDDIAGLVDLINTRPSRYVTAELDTDGTALADTAGTDLTGGADGTPITAAEYGDATDALEFQPFSILNAANLTDSAIQAQITSWVQAQEEAMRPVRAVFGGAPSESLDQAITRTDGIRDPHVISLGAGTFHDDFLDKDVGTAKVAARVAGALAGIGSGRALTYLPFAGLTLVDPVEVTSDRLREAADQGVTVFRRSSDPAADLVVSRGVTTFVDTGDVARPLAVFSEPRLVGIIDDFIRRVKIWGDANIVGLPNSADTRAAVRDYGSGLLAELFADGLILNDPDKPYFFRTPDPDPEVPDLIPFEFGFQFVQTTNFLVGVGKVRV